VPKSGTDIHNRINEISFNSSLFRELRAIQFVHDLIADGRVERGTMRDVLVHMIADDDLMRDLGVATKLVPSPVILSRLKTAGRAAADAFLQGHRADLNIRGTVDLEEMFS
jgi:NTE family protein